MTQMLPPKKDVALALLERSNVDVYLDPRAGGVVVPPQFRKEPQLILKIGLNMPVPIPDLRFDEESMSCTLSFSRVPFFCVVPWASVFAMVGEDGRGMVWPDDVPRELSVKMVDESRPGSRPSSPGGATAEAPSTRTRGRSKLVDASRPGPRAVEDARSTNKRASKKKKKEGTRPTLVAVPPPAASGPALTAEAAAAAPQAVSPKTSAEASDARATSEAAEPPKAAPAPQASAPSSDRAKDKTGAPAPSRPKRELPPYLRVVK